MTSDRALDALADDYGILDRYVDLGRNVRKTSRETKKAMLRAGGLVLDNDAMIDEALAEIRAAVRARKLPNELIVTAGKPVVLDLCAKDEWVLNLEGNQEITIQGRGRFEQPQLGAGIHTLTVRTGVRVEDVVLISAPDAAPSIGKICGRARLWGVNGALYGLRSERNCGVGDFEDMATASEAFGTHGAAFLGINPVHSLGWSDDQTISPYSPSHRGFLNTTHIAVDRIPGLETSPKAAKLLREAASGSAGPQTKLIDYAAVNRRVKPLLQSLFDVFQKDAAPGIRAEFERFCRAQGNSLADFTTFEALSEEHGSDWRTWPDDLRSPLYQRAQNARQRLAPRIRFHAWMQWVAAMQIGHVQSRARGAGMALGLYLDLAVGSNRGGAETWCDGDTFAQGVSIGAPPDHLSPNGQNWNLAAYAPEKLAQSKYRAFRQVLRGSMQHAGMLRIDHVLGMNRSFWIPDDGSPGGYIRQPFQSLLAVIAIEATRAGTAVIGEDLGLVPDGFRKATSARGLYSYSVLQFEKGEDGKIRAADTMRPNSLACFGTHDTPTLSGFRTGRDIDWWQKLGWIDKDKAAAAHRARQQEVTALMSWSDDPARASAPADPAMCVHTALAQSPAALVSIQLDDLARQSEAQNLPGTIDEHPNWRRRLAVPVEQFEDWSELSETGRMMTRNGRNPSPVVKKETAQ